MFYGDYDTEEAEFANSTSVYLARKRGRQYVIKVYRPGLDAAENQSDFRGQGHLGENPFGKFIAAAAIQKKMGEHQPRHGWLRGKEAGGFAPVHDFKLTGTEAWYATEHYPRGSLKGWIARRPQLDADDLRTLLARVVGALLEMQQLIGRSHGNLKPANILRGGKTGSPVNRTPLYLSDPQPGSEEPARAFERADLRALGELIIQLVTCRAVNSPDDYNNPIEPTVEWNKLGNEKDYWLGLCNRLLYPSLPAGAISLESLAKELQARRRVAPAVWLAATVVILIVVDLSYLRLASPDMLPGTFLKRLAAGLGNTRAGKREQESRTAEAARQAAYNQ